VVASVDIRDEQHEINTTAKNIDETGWELIDFSASFYESKTWEKLSQEAQAFSPDSLAKAILTNDSVKRIAKFLTGEHEYRVSVDVLTDKLSELVEHGLAGSVNNWNETNHDELARYVRTQKRAAKKVRRKPVDKTAAGAVVIPISSEVKPTPTEVNETEKKTA
jgi:hypothetical protein